MKIVLIAIIAICVFGLILFLWDIIEDSLR